MVKIIGFIRRRPDLTFDAFSEHWRTRHRAEAEKLRRWLTGYVQAHLSPGPLADVARPADGCPILWVEAAEDMAELAASQAFRTGAYLDEPRFMEARSSGLAVQETVIAPPRRGGVKLMVFASPRDGTALPFDAAGGWLCGTEHACGHVRNRALAPHTVDPQYGFGGVEELWWSDRAAFERDWATAPPLADLGWCDPVRLKAAFVEEVEVFALSPTGGTR